MGFLTAKTRKWQPLVPLYIRSRYICLCNIYETYVTYDTQMSISLHGLVSKRHKELLQFKIVGKRSEQSLHKRRWTNGQKKKEKNANMLNFMPSVVTREGQLKPRIYHYILIGLAKLKSLITLNFGKDVKMKHYHTLLMEMWSGKTSLENRWQFLKKLKHTATRRPNRSNPKYLPKRNNKCLH